MSKPSLEVFTESARKALRVVCEKQEYRLASVLLDGKGPAFDFNEDAGIDSIELVDLVFYVEKDLGVKLQIEKLKLNNELMTLQNLYDTIQQDATTPA